MQFDPLNPDMRDYHNDGRTMVPVGFMDRVLIRSLGEYDGFDVWEVDGETIRNELCQDFCEGGNSARYGFIPLDQIWIESRLEPTDQVPVILHEHFECVEMMTNGASYDDAHDRANVKEHELRRAISSGAFDVGQLASDIAAWAEG
jgi:hypothetical protein